MATLVEPVRRSRRAPAQVLDYVPERKPAAVVSTRVEAMSARTGAGGVPERKVPPTSVRGAMRCAAWSHRPGREAVEAKGLAARWWLLLRRVAARHPASSPRWAMAGVNGSFKGQPVNRRLCPSTTPSWSCSSSPPGT